MGELTQPIDPRYSRVIHDIYGAALDIRRWPQALQGVADLFNATGSMVLWGSPESGLRSFCSPGLRPMVDAWLDVWWRNDLRNERIIEKGLLFAGVPLVDHDILTDEEMQQHPFFKDFLTPSRCHWFVAAPFMIRPEWPLVLNAMRAKEAGPYGEADKTLLMQIGAHAAQAVALTLRIVEAEAQDMIGRQAFDRLACAVFVCDADGNVSFQNEASRQLEGGGVAIRSGLLSFMGKEAQSEFRAALGRIFVDGRVVSVGSTFRVDRGGDGALVVHVIPAESAPDVDDPEMRALFTARRALVYVIDPSNDAVIDPVSLETALGLTPAEARVAALVGRGLSPDVAADQLGLSTETVRSVLKSIFAKLGIGRQGELARIVTRLSQVRSG